MAMKLEELLLAVQSGAITPQSAAGVLERMRRPTAAHPTAARPTAAPLPDSRGLRLDTVMSLDDVGLREWRVGEPAAGEVTIQVSASAINFPDVMCVQGLYPTMPDWPFVPGFEVAGTVAAIGPGVSSLSVGDEVIATTGKELGGHASYVNVPGATVYRKPANLTFEEACSIPVVFGTVSYAFDIAKLAPREQVLVQTATGGCGLAALQLAALRGAACYGTSSRPEKLEILRRLGVEHALDYTRPFDEEIRQLTGGRGVDVVLNMLGGEAIQRGLNSLAACGRYLEIAVHALRASAKLDLSRLVHNQSFHSIDLRRLAAGRGGGESFERILELFESGRLVPIVSRIYPLTQAQEALRYVAQGHHIGKVVVSHREHSMIDCTERCIQALIEQRERCRASADARYTESAYRDTSPPPARSTPRSLEPAASSIPRSDAQPGDIAIIGMSGAFPKAKDLTEFWDNLTRGRDCVAEIPASRWSLERYYDPNPQAPGKTYCKWMGLLEDMDRFDPLFFNISPAEADAMDPQQRLFLQHSWSCIEEAGLNPLELSGSRCGVYVGCLPGDYGQFDAGDGLTAQRLMGGSLSILSARISYFLNLKGPCLAIDTACSSSLVAISEACDSLTAGRSDLALAGGVCVLTGPALHIMVSRAGMFSREGRCFTFDARADGFVPGEGVGVLLLKRLEDAVRDRDHIHAVIRGWCVNHDGRTNGMTAPSVSSQILLEREVYERFRIDPGSISLVEAHGTGTKLGDPIEVEALTQSFRAHTDRRHYCALGSVKTNIGHLLGAAGVAGVVKAVLALKHRMLPPTINYESPNEHVILDQSPFYINQTLRPWQMDAGGVRRAAVSSFGFSGTNAHLVVEEYGEPPAHELASRASAPRQPALIVLSARNAQQLREQADRLLEHLRNRLCADGELHDIAYTLQVGRAAMDRRLALVAATASELQEKLAGFLDGRVEKGQVVDFFLGEVKKDDAAASLFNTDGALQPVVTSWIEQGEYAKLLGLWVRGLRLDWRRLYAGTLPRRVSLPTYPFAKERYWIKSQPPGASPSPPPAADAQRPDAAGETDPPGEPLAQSARSGPSSDAASDPAGDTAPDVQPRPDHADPRNEFESTIVTLWKEVLGLERISIHDDILMLGGNSIVAAQIIARLKNRYSDELSLAEIFTARTVAQMAEILEEEILDRLAAQEMAHTAGGTPLETDELRHE